jgi:uncharacterized protein
MNKKLSELKSILFKHGRVLIAFSGGVDSSFLAYAAVKTLGKNNVLAVTAVSETYSKDELALAKSFTKKYGIRHMVIKTSEFTNPDFVKNPVNRCFYCKDELFKKLTRMAGKEKMILCDATNYTDRTDYRPGREAAKKWKVSSPIFDAKITKDEIRALSRKFKLPTWDMPAKACLASRVPYGTQLDKTILKRIDKSEKFLLRFGVKNLRVRHHGTIARIETDPVSFKELIRESARISSHLKKLGWKHICLDIDGYRTGSLNPKTVKNRK